MSSGSTAPPFADGGGPSALQAAKNAISAAVEVESEQRMGQAARIAELEALLEEARLQVRPLARASPPFLPSTRDCLQGRDA